MSHFVTQHGMYTAWHGCCKFWGSVELARWPQYYCSMSNQPHNHRPCVTTATQDLHFQHLHLQDPLRPTTQTATAPAISLHNRRLGYWRFGEVFSPWMNPSWNCIWRRVGEWFADVSVVNGVAHGGSGVHLWCKWVHFIDGILNARRYCDEILTIIIVLFIHNPHLMLQHDNSRPHGLRVWTQSGMLWLSV